MWNTELVDNIMLGTAVVVPIIVALVQMIKMIRWIPSEYAPFISIGVGILISFLLSHDYMNFSGNVLAGILFGLSASGLYSGIQTSTVAIKSKNREKIEKKNKLNK